MLDYKEQISNIDKSNMLDSVADFPDQIKKSYGLVESSNLMSIYKVDNIIFTLIAFAGVLPWDIIAQIFLTSLMLKIIVATCDTPFMYLARKIKPSKSIIE